jgi:Tfp pilus assembly PilM family ATPase
MMSSIIGMELSESHLKAVEIQPGGRYPKLLNFSMIEFDMVEGKSTAIRRTLKERGFGSRTVNLAASDIMLVHRLIDLPPMSKKEMQVVVPREIEYQIADTWTASPITMMGKDFSFDYQLVEGGVMAIAAPNRLIRDSLSFVQDAGLKCQVFATIPLALVNLPQLRNESPSDTSLLVHPSAGSCYMAICSRDELLFANVFPAQLAEDGNVERIVSRVTKAVVFFKRRFNREVDSVTLSGETSGPNNLAEAIGQELGITVEAFDPEETLDITPLGDEAQAFQELMPSFAVPIGLALRGKKDFRMNLLPTSKGAGLALGLSKAKKVALAVAILSLLSSIIMAYMSVGLSKVEKQHRRTLETLEASISGLKPILAEQNRTETEREIYEARGRFLQRLRERNILLSKTFEELRAITPDQIILSSLHLERTAKDGWQLNIKGEISAGDILTAITEYNNFSLALKASPFFINVSALPPSFSSSSRQKGIEITCRLKWNPLIISESK